jgi:hypothetical protein
MPPPKADLDQVRNGSFAAPIDPPDWVNGNAGSSNAHYSEGESIAYRLRLTNIALSTHVIEIEWDIKHSSVNAIDYITHYDRSVPTPLPCLGVAGCNAASFATFAIPAPSSNGSPVLGQPTSSFNALPAGKRLMTIYNGTITGLTYVTQGSLTAAQSSTRLQINFTASSPTVVIAWGGHIASRGDWGFTNGVPNSAGGISGSPYHTRLISFDGSGGNQDRSLSAAAVRPPGGCQLSGPDTVCESDTSNHYEVTNPESGVNYVWSLPVNTSGASISASNGTAGSLIYADVDPGGPGTYTLRATPQNAGGTGTPCDIVVTVQANTAATDLTDISPVCPGTNANFSTTASGGDGSCTFAWTLDGNPLTDTDNSVSIDTTGLTPGNHTVEVTVDCGCGPTVKQSSTFAVLTKTNITDEVDNAEACLGSTDLIPFSVTAVGVNLSYAWTLDSVSVGGNTSSININPSALSAGPHEVKVTVTGTCGSDTSTANLQINSNPTVTITLSQACDTVSKLTATAGFDTYAWSGPTPVVDATGTCGPNKACLLVNKTGTYTVNVTDANSCDGSQTAQLCFTITSPAPSAPAGLPVKAPPSKPTARGSLLSKLVSVMLWAL